MLEAVVQVEFAGGETLAELSVDPEFIAVSPQAGRVAVIIGVEQMWAQRFCQLSGQNHKMLRFVIVSDLQNIVVLPRKLTEPTSSAPDVYKQTLKGGR